MADLSFAVSAYSFRNTASIYGRYLQPRTHDEATLAAIEAKFIEAHNDFFARKYQDAILAYKEAQALIYRQIDPSFPPGAVHFTQLSSDRALFQPLLSASLEWMNVLPIDAPVSPVLSRVPFVAENVAASAPFDQTGVRSVELATPAARAALADISVSQSYAAQGNAAAASFFSARAKAADPVTFAKLDLSHNGAAAPAPAGPAGAGPLARNIPAGPGVFQPAVVAENLAPGLANLPLEALRSHVAAGSVATLTSPVLGEVSGQISAGLLAAANAGAANAAATLPPDITSNRAVGTMLTGQLVTLNWNAGDAPPANQVESAIYQSRIQNNDLSVLLMPPAQPSDLALQLPHDYYYVAPLGLAECYHALGDFAQAEAFYLQAASYQYLNPTVEGAYLWQRLATLYLDWGNSLFRRNDTPGALAIYTRVVNVDGSAPNSQLFSLPGLQPAAAVAKDAISKLNNITTFTGDPAVAAIIVDINAQLVKIQAGLDFWGFWHPSVPIWTFDYLQSLAINFSQLALSAERDVINYWDRAGQAALTREQIEQSVTQAQAEGQVAQLQADAAGAEVGAYDQAVALAQQRAADAQANASEYAGLSAQWIQHQALSAQMGGGSDGNAEQLNRYADVMTSGGYSLHDERGTLSAAEQLAGARLNRKYEIDAMNRQAAELNTAAAQAQAERAAAQARQSAAQAAVSAANLRAQSAQSLLNSFDNQFFTPDVWQRMGDTMWRLYRRYFNMALYTARVMQQAYNFETDQSLNLIKSDYSTDEVKGLLGADALMADIQTFSYDLITSTSGKPQPIRQTISLAERAGFRFEKQFRTTGAIDFQTSVVDFDARYPGTYAGRIEAVEVTLDGIIPPTGVSGTLTNSGISSYRTPTSGPDITSGLKYRVQSRETLVLSDYATRQDALLVTSDQRMLRIFQGAGVASTWHLEIPRDSNDIDFDALTDVRLTFYYKARFDPDLRNTVKAQLAALPEVNSRQWGIPLRWLYPDAFFHFQGSGDLKITLRPTDFRLNETKPVLTDVSIVVATNGSVSPSGITASLATPGKAPVKDKTNADGVIQSDAGSPWAGLIGGSAVGDYTISAPVADNPALAPGGTPNFSPIVNIALVLGFSFTPRA